MLSVACNMSTVKLLKKKKLFFVCISTLVVCRLTLGLHIYHTSVLIIRCYIYIYNIYIFVYIIYNIFYYNILHILYGRPRWHSG